MGSDKKRYQIEVPQSAASKAGPEYNLEGARKGFKRFSTSETKVCYYWSYSIKLAKWATRGTTILL